MMMNYGPKPTAEVYLNQLGIWAVNHTVPAELRQLIQGLISANRSGELALITPPNMVLGGSNRLFTTIYGPEGLCYVTVHHSKVDEIKAVQYAELSNLERTRQMDNLGRIFTIFPENKMHGPRGPEVKRDRTYSDVVNLIGLNALSNPHHLRVPFITADIHYMSWAKERDQQIHIVKAALGQALLHAGLADNEWHNRMNSRITVHLAETDILEVFAKKYDALKETSHARQLHMNSQLLPIQVQLFNEGADQFMKFAWVDESMAPEAGYVLPFQDVHPPMLNAFGGNAGPSFGGSYVSPGY